ncbi:ATP-binding cassette domain-containing protein, partial [Geminicoccus flavidas]|uniref:ATP-binding cassette domain-containing protein n=1 Tax=Geminicoccus flavidas TaxID=2506407 RepID=UPI00135B16F3
MSAAQLRASAPAAAPAPAGLSIELRQVSKSFGQLSVLHGFELTVPAGQFLAVVGRSGGGKSTLMRLISGLDTPSHGGVSVGGA